MPHPPRAPHAIDAGKARRRPLPAPEPERIMPTAWLLIWTIYCVKLAMMLAIFWAAGTLDPMAVVTISTWFWLGPALAIVASPAALKVRLLRMRRRRAALIASEWSVG